MLNICFSAYTLTLMDILYLLDLSRRYVQRELPKSQTISTVVKYELCTGCGTCIALCPEEAIKLTINEKKGIYVPELDEEKCNNCGICLKVCSGHEVDFKTLNLEIFGKEPEDILIGNYINCYVGHSTDYEIRNKLWLTSY